MDTNNWVAVIGCILIILATLFGRWWLLHHQYRKQNNTKVVDEERQKFLKRLDEHFEPAEPIQDRWPVFAVTKLDILTSAKDPAHPHGKHLMTFKTKNYSLDMGGVIYKFECLYCRHEAKLLKKDFWGTPKDAWANWGKRSYETGVDHGVLYTPLDGVMRIGEFKPPQPPQTDRSDAMLMNLMAYAELAKQNPIPEDLWGGEYTPHLPPDRGWVTTAPINADIKKDVDQARE